MEEDDKGESCSISEAGRRVDGKGGGGGGSSMLASIETLSSPEILLCS